MALHDIDAIRLGEILRAPGEIALIDLRPAIAFGNGAPLHGANVPLVELDARIDALVPHRHTPIALIDGDGSLVRRAAGQLAERGYETVYSLRGGVDDNERLPVVPIRVAAPRIISGDVERSFRTPVTTARELVRLREAGTPAIVLDTRSLEEYAREHIPDSYPAPGGEIATQFHALVRSPEVRVITTCAGRSRAVLAAQTLIDGGVANPVSTLDFGTLGWRDLGLPLAHGAERAPAPV
ncbi:rhodanese-like domain-containing protein, partial [Burkholderia sp. Ac-20379]|uniref:rhodanese-like domain-containing protein n=1 Tax=Burkholderia sp. Ac-20379 TaxID=2703900 RepID=UPI001DCEE5E8